ncbi:hydrogenase maturation protease [Saccharomonospora piscinae]|uniref:Peptidase M52 n=1 Tax=Saccharomonospora piscinae TaxID=687388 RepID=A0A1V8ZYG5_SACPI|nr:hydrogenase maturation protease [Saccharomonospora piscinae]OQO89850.1 peptidase M52 [Saccharomonospora piscinae]TLW90626.1 hydrogenase maturation protease [Saccharomonospora piscinae]
MTSTVLIAGIGNVFHGDDGFGVEVVNRLSTRDLPPEAVVADYGIRGVHLAYELLDGGYATTIFVDATRRGGDPGTLYVLDADPATDIAAPEHSDEGPVIDAHGMHPAAVLALLRRLGGTPGRVFVVGCEPLTLAEGMGLSAPVAAAVDEAVARVRELATDAVERGGVDVSRHSR